MKKTSILVTGGAGYIGSHTAKLLDKAGYRPVILDNLREGHRWATQDHLLIGGDISDTAFMAEIMRREKIKAVIHFAAYAYVGESVENPHKYYKNNVVGALSLLDAMVEARVDTIIFSSTCATYGYPETIPIKEDAPQQPVNPYGETKRAVEGALKWYGNAYGLHWAALRYFNAAGADPEGELGEVHRIETHLIPLAIFTAMGRRGPLKVFGTDYSTPDGTCIRDYIHVNDLGDAHVKALEYLQAGGESIALNLGTGKGYSVREVLDATARVTGLPVPAEDTERRPGDPPELVGDASQAGTVLNWTPQYTDIDRIIETAYTFYKHHEDLLPE